MMATNITEAQTCKRAWEKAIKESTPAAQLKICQRAWVRAIRDAHKREK